MEIKKISGEILWYDVTMEPGNLIHQELKEFLVRENLEEAFVLSCIGSCSRVVVVYPLTKEIPPRLNEVTFEGLFEMNSIQGSVRRLNGTINVHLHGSLTKEGKEVFGGAIHDGTEIFMKAELVIMGIKKRK